MYQTSSVSSRKEDTAPCLVNSHLPGVFWVLHLRIANLSLTEIPRLGFDSCTIQVRPTENNEFPKAASKFGTLQLKFLGDEAVPYSAKPWTQIRDKSWNTSERWLWLSTTWFLMWNYRLKTSVFYRRIKGILLYVSCFFSSQFVLSRVHSDEGLSKVPEAK